MKAHSSKRRTKPLDLRQPVGQHRQRHYYQMRPFLVEIGLQTGHEADRLDGLAQTHLVAQDHRHAVLEHMHHPADPLDLNNNFSNNNTVIITVIIIISMNK